MVGMIIMSNEQYYRPINSDRPEGVIRNPSAINYPIQRGFSGPIQTLPFQHPSIQRGPLCIYTEICEAKIN